MNDMPGQQHRERHPPKSPLGVAIRYTLGEWGELGVFLNDVRVPVDNNASVRSVRRIAVGRKAWMFCGSDGHAQSAANLFSLIASCKLHGIDPETYLADVIRIVPYWPRDRYLELAPRYWVRTRERLDQAELELPVGHVTIPPRAAEQQPTSS